MNTLVRGSLAGLVATGTMTIEMYAAKAAGFLQTPPPKEITGRAESKAGAQPQSDFSLQWLAAHLGFGVGCGIIYTMIRNWLPGDPKVKGLLFGGMVWAVSYLGVMPSLGLYPWPSEDSNSRTATMIAAHAVYGETLALTEDRFGD